jgi:hypothetical protein
MNLHPSVIEFLVSIGFRAEQLNNPQLDTAEHPAHPGITVGHLKRVYSTTRFRLTFNRYATGDDGVRVYAVKKCPIVPPKVIDTTKPRWRESASAWFQSIVFATKPARDERETEVLKEVQQKQALRALLGEYADEVDSIEKILTIVYEDDHQPVGVFVTGRVLSARFTRTDLPANQIVAIARVLRFAKEQGVELR